MREVMLARGAVSALGGRYSAELGIDVDAGDAQIERWFLAATLFGRGSPPGSRNEYSASSPVSAWRGSARCATCPPRAVGPSDRPRKSPGGRVVGDQPVSGHHVRVDGDDLILRAGDPGTQRPAVEDGLIRVDQPVRHADD